MISSSIQIQIRVVPILTLLFRFWKYPLSSLNNLFSIQNQDLVFSFLSNICCLQTYFKLPKKSGFATSLAPTNLHPPLHPFFKHLIGGWKADPYHSRNSHILKQFFLNFMLYLNPLKLLSSTSYLNLTKLSYHSRILKQFFLNFMLYLNLLKLSSAASYLNFSKLSHRPRIPKLNQNNSSKSHI